jgi:hypothetical protein
MDYIIIITAAGNIGQSRRRECLDGGGEMRAIPKLFIALLLCAPPLVAGKDKPLSDAELAEITTRGRMLAEYDSASLHATAALMTLKPELGTVRSYVARKTVTGWVVEFGRFTETQDAFLIVYEATEGSNPEQFEVKTYDPPQRDTGFSYIAAKSIDLALRTFQGGYPHYNTYVLPQDSGQMYVYVVPAQLVKDVYPLGGDVRYLISADGSTITETRRLHATVITETGNSVPAGSKQVAGFHTHVLSDVPEDTDVFYVLRRKPSLPEYIATKSHTYEVQTDGTIKCVK